MSGVSLKFAKLQGTGNSFLFVDLRTPTSQKNWKKVFPKKSRSKVAKEYCDPHFGVGADGFAIFEFNKNNVLGWDFYNSDGSKAEMCGNAARCAGLFLSGASSRPRSFELSTGAGPVSIKYFDPDDISVTMPVLKNWKVDQHLVIGGRSIRYDFLNSGVPHVVIRLGQLKIDERLREIALKIQKHSRFRPQGTNVSFYSIRSRNKIHSASFERGVEGFTLACGTGAVACAAVHGRNSGASLVHLQVPGGKLKVDLKHKRPLLIGPARKIIDFRVPKDN